MLESISKVSDIQRKVGDTSMKSVIKLVRRRMLKLYLA